MESTRKTLGIFGMGAFGRFMVRHLSPWFTILANDIAWPSQETLKEEEAEAVRCSSPAETAACDIVVFAVPLDSLAAVVREAVTSIRPGALVLDVTSVKTRPVEILSSLVPEHADLLATHPLFGPQSGKNGIAGLRIALCPVRITPELYYRVCDFLTERLHLLVLKTDPDSHDREMARVQAMTHFMSRALREIGVPPSQMATRAYEKLQEFTSIVLSDSWDLFLTIQKGNPYAVELRRRFLAELTDLEEKLE
ncbi:MAG: prephenate dehydrogenase [Planctomycetota bacterium]|jgi:prephenate dehydrogenase|nr:prephenate dehydrogenase [Planctomycetota bacterium]